jgi:hypothetical protein
LAVNQRGAWFIDEAKPLEIACVASSFAKLMDGPNAVRAPRFWRALDEHGARLVEAGDSRFASNTMWALAKLNVVAPTFFFAVGKRGARIIAEGKSGEIANLAWAFACFGLEAPILLSAISARSEELVNEGTTREIANIMFAFGKIDSTTEVDVDTFYEEVDKRGPWIVENGNMQDIANISRGFSNIGIKCPRFFHAVQKASVRLVTDETNVRAICNIALSLAKLDVQANSFLEAVDRKGEYIIANGHVQDVANAACALARKGKGELFFKALDLRGPTFVNQILELTKDL